MNVWDCGSVTQQVPAPKPVGMVKLAPTAGTVQGANAECCTLGGRVAACHQTAVRMTTGRGKGARGLPLYTGHLELVPGGDLLRTPCKVTTNGGIWLGGPLGTRVGMRVWRSLAAWGEGTGAALMARNSSRH